MTSKKVIPIDDYPLQLDSWKKKEKPLWYLGDTSLLNHHMISIIGTRNPSNEGISRTKEVAKASVSCGFCVVSGMAKGIDTTAHWETLKSKGNTIAVMGTHINACYPKVNIELKKKIIESGLVLSQFSPNEKTGRYNFPKRNELMAELSDITIVIEAGSKSGTRYQIEKAVQLKKTIVFFKALVDCNYKWVKDYLSYKKLKIFNNTLEFTEWLIYKKKGNGNNGSEGEKELLKQIVDTPNNFKDAIDYIEDLKKKINQRWFNELCFFTRKSFDQTIDKDSLDNIRNILLSNKNYPLKNLSTIDSRYKKYSKKTQQLNLFSEKLEYVGEFSNFKKLGDKIEIKFPSPITIIFGNNNSGKTSICHAIKKLTGENIENNIDTNIFNESNNHFFFKYKFSNDREKKTYDSNKQNNEYLNHYNGIKYFDSKISARLIEKPNTENLLEVAPFKLELFEHLQNNLEKFQDYMNNLIKLKKEELLKNSNRLKLLSLNKGIKADIYDEIDNEIIDRFSKMIKLESDKKLISKLNELNKHFELLSNPSPEKLKRINIDILQLNKIIMIIKKLEKRIIELDIPNHHSIETEYKKLKSTQQKEMEFIIPNQKKIEEFKSFIRISKNIVDYEKENDKECLFCRRELDTSSEEVIKKYYVFLRSKSEERIFSIGNLIKTRNNIKNNIKECDFDLLIFDYLLSSFKNFAKDIKPKINTIIEYCLGSIKEDDFFQKYKNELTEKKLFRNEIDTLELILKEKIKEKEIIRLNDHEKSKEFIRLKKEKEEIEFKKTFYEHIKENKFLYSLWEEYFDLKNKLNNINFKNIKSQITNYSKEATEYLIKSSFEEKLNKEYQKLTKKYIHNTGIASKAIKKGKKVSLSLSIKGKHPLRYILSEGELKIHSLALFFVEIEYEEKSIIIFDDPVSSLDHTYIDRISRRIRDFAKDNLDKQIIIFTHNWYFLKNIQDELIMAKFKRDIDFSLYILKNCSSIEVNTEQINKIKYSITSILDKHTTLSKDEKISLTVNMRNLIEVMINKYVFNEQRMQYKRDKMNPSMFDKYINLRPLTEEEANSFKDLYNNLSRFLHDSNFDIVDEDINNFKSYYSQLLNLENQLKNNNSIIGVNTTPSTIERMDSII